MIWPMAKINQPRPTDGELEILRVLWQRGASTVRRSEEHTSELQSQSNLVCRLLLEIKNNTHNSVNAARGHNSALSARAYNAATTCTQRQIYTKYRRYGNFDSTCRIFNLSTVRALTI